jgi:EmrB/QacA subfamily drug resistance transporter
MVQSKGAQSLTGSHRDVQVDGVKDVPAGESGGLDRKLVGIALVVVLGGFMSILDTTIVNVAINGLSKQFNAPLATIQWVATGYMLALATVIPLTGWGVDRFGGKRLYIASIVLFLLGSALSGAAWSATSLIVFRVLQGLGGGMILPTGITILTHEAGPHRIGRVMGIVGVPMLLGPILGPILGGYLVDDVSWRWIFFVNLPVGAVAIAAAVGALKADAPKPVHRLDWLGLFLLSPGIALLVYGLAQLAAGSGDLAAAGIETIVGVGLITAFILHARGREGALIDVGLFTRRQVAASAATVFLFGAVFFGISLLMPFYFQVVRGEPAHTAGFHVAIQAVGAMFTMPVAGRLTDKVGPGRVVWVGLTLMALGVFSLSRIGAFTPLWQVEASLFVLGLGTGSTMMPSISAGLGALKRAEVARANSGLNAIARVGGSIGTALLAVVLGVQLSQVTAGDGNHLTAAAVRQLSAASSPTVLEQVGHAFGHTLVWSLLLIALAIVAASFLPRKPVAHVAGTAALPTD